MLLFIFILFLIHQVHSCPLTDEYLSRCHCGILTNGESYIKCEENSLEEIPKFKRSFPYDELLLINNHIKNLSATSFDNIKTTRRINLQGNSLSYIDKNLLRLLGNYLEELTLTGDNQINSLEFLTFYPLKKLRVIKLDQFNLSGINLQRIFSNMTKLQIVYLRSCQLKQIPDLHYIQILNLENNFLSNQILLSTFYSQLSLANNQLTSITLQNNPNLKSLDLNSNQLTFINWTLFNDNLTSLNLSSNSLKKIHFNTFPASLSSLDLSSNHLKTIDKNPFFQQLTSLNLNHNPLDCNCHLQWLQNISQWPCSSFHFNCQLMPRVTAFNVTYFTYSSSENNLLVRWTIIDNYHTIHYLQISIEQPYRISQKLPANQTRAFITDSIQFNKRYHVCLILVHKYARDKYCRDIITRNAIVNQIEIQEHEIIFNNHTETIAKSNDFDNKQFYILLIGSCIGGVLTFILLLTCCYLCYQIYRYKDLNQQPVYEKCSQHLRYPIYHTHPTCPHHQIIYNSENISNSTDSSHMDTSLSTTNNLKHICHTIDSQDYCTLSRQQQQHHHHHLLELWNESVKQKR